MLKIIGFNKFKYHTKKLNNGNFIKPYQNSQQNNNCIFLRLFNLYINNNEMS